MVRAYLHVLNAPEHLIQGEIFNVGYHNHTVLELGKMIQEIVGKERPVELVVTPSNDNRSYHVSSHKIAKKLNFHPQFSIERAVADLLSAFVQGKIPHSLDDPRYFNIKTMKAVNLK
jgi:nucleoside-diphosphate-sugar epimerase